jgi:hypothetical protein
VTAAALLVSACGGDDEPELTFEDRLNLLEDEPLTPAEVADRAEVGEALCRLDDSVLDEIWIRLDDDQLDFQDVVFSMLCPDRAVLYAGLTGRYVTEEAEESGVVTSTTRPPSTVTRPSTPIGPTLAPSTTAGSPPGTGSATTTTDPSAPLTSTTSSTTGSG